VRCAAGGFVECEGLRLALAPASGCVPFAEVLRARRALLRAPLARIQALLEAEDEEGAEAPRRSYMALLGVYKEARAQLERLAPAALAR
jgi:hypothetical protein